MEIRQHGLACNRRLSETGEDLRGKRHVDIDPGAETDETEAFAEPRGHRRLDERHDAPRHQAGDLDDADLDAAGIDDEGAALIVLAGLVEFGVQESPGV